MRIQEKTINYLKMLWDFKFGRNHINKPNRSELIVNSVEV